MFLRNKILGFGKRILEIFQKSIIQIVGTSAEDTNQMVVMLAAIPAFEPLYPVTEVDLGSLAVVLNDFDRFENPARRGFPQRG